MKKSAVVLALIFVLFELNGQNIQDMSFGTDSTLDILTWNIERFPKNGSTTIQYVVEVIEALEPDIIALQEIDDQQSFDAIVNSLGHLSGFWDDQDFSGLAYIYDPAVIEMADIFQIYQGMGREFPRPPLVIEFYYNGEFFVVINNHLKCCGNGVLDSSDPWDEETRRLDASNLLDLYIDANQPEDHVIVVGDLNDILTDNAQNNAFSVFINDSANYLFADMDIAEGSSANWSYPNWPSHLDHILVTNELFEELELPGTIVTTIRVDDFLTGGFDTYDDNISDHRPVGLQIMTSGTTTRTSDPFLQSVDLRSFPNPFTGATTIQWAPVLESGMVRIFSSSGHLVGSLALSSGESSVQWDPAGLPSGVYTAQLYGPHGFVAGNVLLRLE